MAPETFAIETDAGRGELMRFLRKLREAMMHGEKDRVKIDFSLTHRMTAAGTLLFAAELKRIKALTSRSLTCSYPRDNLVAQVLQHVGIFQDLGQKRRCKITANNVKYWEVFTGSEVLGETADVAMSRYEHLFSDPQKTLYRGITEAMTNCRQHAYVEERGDGLPNALPNWWMFAQHFQGHLSIAFCDLGMGIPRSLPFQGDHWRKTRLFMRFRRWADSDVERIRASIEVGASKTKKSHRGKGLPDMRKTLDGMGGRVQIHSNRGFYSYSSATRQEKCQNFSTESSIQGTIVLWILPV